VGRVAGPLEGDLRPGHLAEGSFEPPDRIRPHSAYRTDVEEEGPDRQLNIQIDQTHLAGVYTNFANVSFSDYEFTLTFARIDHEVQEGDIPGVVVSRVNMSPKFARELLDALQDSLSKYATVKGIQDLPEFDG
jgi:hypothetical protein